MIKQIWLRTRSDGSVPAPFLGEKPFSPYENRSDARIVRRKNVEKSTWVSIFPIVCRLNYQLSSNLCSKNLDKQHFLN